MKIVKSVFSPHPTSQRVSTPVSQNTQEAPADHGSLVFKTSPLKMKIENIKIVEQMTETHRTCCGVTFITYFEFFNGLNGKKKKSRN